MSIKRQAGISLVELILFIVIVSVGLAGILSVMNLTTRHSADPMVRKQALAAAESLMEEIALKNFSDPDGSEAGETRPSFDDVDDYHGYSSNGIRDINETPIGALAERVVASHGLDLFDLQLRRESIGWVLRVVIDRPPVVDADGRVGMLPAWL